jgi:photosystem II stability/assembly factor-like uncharacterized protein
MMQRSVRSEGCHGGVPMGAQNHNPGHHRRCGAASARRGSHLGSGHLPHHEHTERGGTDRTGPARRDVRRCQARLGSGRLGLNLRDGRWRHDLACAEVTHPPWLFGVSFSDARHGWAVARPGNDVRSGNAIIRTADGGRTWGAQDPGTTAGLNKVAALSRLRAICVGDGGTILSTSNGGATWARVASGTTSSLDDVLFTDARRGWAVGTRGTILATKDSGLSWRRQRGSLQSREVLTGVSFVDARCGWAVGFKGDRYLLLSTRDGGVTWRTLQLGRGIAPDTVVFRSRQHGWMTDIDRILSTDDGGAHWSTQYSPSGSNLANFAALAVPGGAHIWAVGDTGTVVHSFDTGRTWTYRMVGATGQ